MIMAWRGSKRLFACLFPFYAAVVRGPTVYIQAHYLVDAIAGILASYPVFCLSKWAYQKTSLILRHET